jgi:DNA helicase-2/ATP-dependent DNA helicase PcrA
VKGLEFRAVILVGMNEGTFPDFRANTQAALEEERRNAYVAVTRASRLLVLTRPRTRVTRYGNAREQQESRFVREMGLEMAAA